MSDQSIPNDWRWAEESGIRVALPPEWIDVDAEATILAAAGPRRGDEGFWPNINVVVARAPTEGEGLAEMAAAEFEALASVLVELHAIDTEILSAGDREWARTLMAYQGVSHPLTLEQRTTFGSGPTSIVVSATVDTNDWPGLEHDLMRILDSVTWTGEAVE